MIPISKPSRHDAAGAGRPWQRQLAGAVTEPAELLARVGLDAAAAPAMPAAATVFPLRATDAFIRRIQAGHPDDPLLRQILPVVAEDQAQPGFDNDPVGDGPACIAPNLLYKYAGRVLLLVSDTCACHCRFCFRRHRQPEGTNTAAPAWQPALAAIAREPSITEVILSGGDPLLLTDTLLEPLAARLADIDHIQRLRIHSRMPIVLPARIDPALCRWLQDSRLQIVMVVHCNHPNEIDAEVRQALATLRACGCTLLSQSVLLAGVNDDSKVLAALSERLFSAQVLPYYLHMLDAVQGAAHFQVSEARARALVEALRRALPGYLVPRLVREIAGRPAKQPVF